MDEPTEAAAAKPVVKSVKKPVGKTALVVVVVLVLLLTGVAGGGSYYWRDKSAKKFEKQQAATIASLQKSVTDLTKQLADEKSKAAATPATPACTVKQPSAATIDNIEASITSGNTAALEGYMAASVSVAKDAGVTATDTPTQAVTAITTFITSDNTSWDYNFALPAATLSSYAKGAYGKYFVATSVVGKATNKQVISFNFDCNGKISGVYLATNESLIK